MNEEDVVFEGSPLDNHLRECGLQFETEKKDIKNKEQDLPGKKWKLFDNLLGEKSTLIDDHYRHSCMQMLLNSNLLEYEDSTLIREFMENSKNDLKTKIRPTLNKGGIEALIWVTIMALMMFLPSIVNSLLCVLLPLILSWRWQSIVTAPMQARKMKKFLETVGKVDSLIKKALLLIGEYSLISRGYLMVDNSNLVWRLDKSDVVELSLRSQSNLPGLRIAVLDISRRLTIALSDATCELRLMRPLPLNLDHQGLCYPEFDEKIKYELDQGESLPSLDILVSAVNILHLKRSEYLRRLFLDFLFTDSRALNTIVNRKLENNLFNSLIVIDDALTLYKPYVSSIMKQRELTYDKSRSCLGELTTCIHSLSIHIMEALCNSREIEDIMEKCDELMCPETDKLNGMCEKINYHLKCAGLCVERTMILLSKKGSDTETSSICKTISSTISSDSLQMAAEEVAQVKEYIAQDEVFELYNAGEEKISTMGEEYARETGESLDNKSKTLIMKELRNVLVVKAADWKERERKAKMRQSSGGIDLSGSENESEDESFFKNVCDTTTDEKKVEEKIDGSVMPSQSDECNLDTWSTTAGINEPFVCSSSLMIRNLAAEAVTKAIAQRPVGLPPELFECSGSEGSHSD